MRRSRPRACDQGEHTNPADAVIHRIISLTVIGVDAPVEAGGLTNQTLHRRQLPSQPLAQTTPHDPFLVLGGELRDLIGEHADRLTVGARQPRKIGAPEMDLGIGNEHLSAPLSDPVTT